MSFYPVFVICTAIVLLLGFGVSLIILYWVWSYVFELFLRFFELNILFKDFLFAHYRRKQIR